MPKLLSVNVGTPQQIAMRRGRPMLSAIAKAPVDGRVRVEGVNLAGDAQADLRVHGGPDKAVYAYAREDIAWWEEQLEREIPPGMFGENLTTEGIDVSGALIGERWRIGTVELEVCQPRQPCSKLGIRFENLRMVKRFAQASRPGAYLRIITEGELGAGDEIAVTDLPDHAVTIAQVSDAILLDDTLIPQVVGAAALPGPLRDWMRAQAA
ncbi:MOSC domain-containing protein [Solirubrobacter phytolaccae]|uniref:MOSC domain-containing protein n=1 Tax=Solirubrobacter phytolaccae TaxID=1404360 RepID=A0A9X3NHU2_9ACTN|nr:MOSC domain-containing protein [Solirubrobacter phytolaccae]MDA0185362.1 MOSC domain-containing protein [Solirubrobacter phytolaccae]